MKSRTVKRLAMVAAFVLGPSFCSDTALNVPKELPDLAATERKNIDIGIAVENMSASDFKTSYMDRFSVDKYVPLVKDIEDVIEMDLPETPDKYERTYGIMQSFAGQHDRYVCFIRKDTTMSIMKEAPVLFIIGDPTPQELERIIDDDLERDRPTATKKEAIAMDDEEKERIMKERRIVSVALGLHDVDTAYAKGLFDAAAKVYERFGLEFYVENVYDHPMEKGWTNKSEHKRLRKESKGKTDLCLILTNRDWRAEGQEEYELKGESISADGFAWVEAQHGRTEVVDNIIHEIGHLFEVEDDQLKGSIMNPYWKGKGYVWSKRAEETILRNKFRTWNDE